MESYEAFIPAVVPHGYGEGSLWRLQATDQPKPKPSDVESFKDLRPTLWELREDHLYEHGLKALKSVERLRLKGPWLLRQPLGIRVITVDDGMIQHAYSASAQLGLALLILLQQSGAECHKVMATGELGDDGADDRILVNPVACLDTKLTVIHDQLAGERRIPGLDLLFIPTTTEAGEPVLERHAEQIAAIEAQGVTVIPVATLAEAAAALKIDALIPHPWERRLRRLLASLAHPWVGPPALVLLLLCGGAYAWLVRDIPLVWGTVPVDGQLRVTPLRVVPVEDGWAESPPCKAADGIVDLYRNGDQVGVRVGLAQPPGPLEGGLGFYPALVVVGERSGATTVELVPAVGEVFPVVLAGEPLRFGQYVGIRGRAEQHLLAVLVRRARPWDNAELQRKLTTLIPTPRASERPINLGTARARLEALAAGTLFYIYENTEDAEACPG